MNTGQPTIYQNDVNALKGAMGPMNPALWPNTGPSQDPWSLNSQPLYYSPGVGKYVTSFDQNAAPQSVSFQNLPDNYGVIGASPIMTKGPEFGKKRRYRSKKSKSRSKKTRSRSKRGLKKRSKSKKSRRS
jgi:hypothetical protein